MELDWQTETDYINRLRDQYIVIERSGRIIATASTYGEYNALIEYHRTKGADIVEIDGGTTKVIY